MNLTLALVCFVVGFVSVTTMKYLLLYKNLQREMTYSGKRDSALRRANRKLSIFIPLFYLLVWVLCSSFYFSVHVPNHLFYDALITGILWLVLIILSEWIFWTLGKHRLKIDNISFFKDTQPWNSISYYAVLVSPLIIAFATT